MYGGIRKVMDNYVFAFSGPTTSVDTDSARERFYTDEVWDLIVAETNRYAAQQRQQASTHGRPWNDVTVEEMKDFVGMQILMGISRLPRIEILV